MPESPESVAVVTVTYRSEPTIGLCIRALPAACEGVEARAYVIDNASDDFSVDAARDAAAAIAGTVPTEVIPRHSNSGFAVGANIGMDRALPTDPDWLLFCNPDAVLPPGSVSALVEVAKSWPRPAVVSPALINLDGSPQPMIERTYRIGRVLAGMARIGGANRAVPAPEEGAPLSADWVHAAVLLVPARILRAMGGFDESFFMYAEDMDFCLRARQAGADIVVAPSVRVPHVSGASAALSGGEPFRAADRVSGLGLFLRKEHGRWASTLFGLATAATSLPAAVVRRSGGNVEEAELQRAKAVAGLRVVAGRRPRKK
ncbi:MAG TPA: glycosyltransferase family 2 protein [Acidimicrobiales bacterium]|nr:glycosyltransferase family 2 protein [Acidimicrobiales bacterium]